MIFRMMKRQTITDRKGRNKRMKRFAQLISVIAAIAALLGCLCVSAGAEGPTGSLTVTIQGNTQGISTAGITVNLFRIGGEEAGTWKLESAFAETGYMNAWQEQSGTKMNNALRKIRGIVNDRGITPTVTGKSDNNGTVRFDNLPRGIYFGYATGAPKEMAIQSFTAHVPEAGSGNMDAAVILKNTVTIPKTETPYTVTIHYIYEDGTVAHKDYLGTYWPGNTYDIYSPLISGYLISVPRVNGSMPSRNLQFTVIYLRSTPGTTIVNIRDYETPLGLGDLQMHVGVCFE